MPFVEPSFFVRQMGSGWKQLADEIEMMAMLFREASTITPDGADRGEIVM